MGFLTILYFVYDPRSEFNYIVDEEERLKEVCDANGYTVPKFSKDELDCISIYKKMTTTTSTLLLSSTHFVHFSTFLLYSSQPILLRFHLAGWIPVGM